MIDYIMILLILLFFILGTAVGSFLNVVIGRSVRNESILGRSYCDHCKAALKTLDLIPIISFAALGAKCRYCKKKLSLQYPIVEFLTGLLFSVSFIVQANMGNVFSIALPYFLFLVSTLIIVAVVDFKFSLIPTTFVFFASLVSLFYNYFFLQSALFAEHVFIAFTAAAFFLAVVVLTSGRGMGEGDIILAFLMGMVLGLKGALLALFLGFLTGAVCALILIAFGKKRFGQTIPFAPFLALGFIVALFWAGPIINWYLMLY